MTTLLAFLLLLGADDRVDRLPKEHRDWIEKEVVYIIAGKEREAFLDLVSQEERVAFIFRVAVKNQARTEYTIFETVLMVPERNANEPWLGAPVPLYGFARLEETSTAADAPAPYRTYRMGAVVLDPAPSEPWRSATISWRTCLSRVEQGSFW